MFTIDVIIEEIAFRLCADGSFRQVKSPTTWEHDQIFATVESAAGTIDHMEGRVRVGDGLFDVHLMAGGWVMDDGRFVEMEARLHRTEAAPAAPTADDVARAISDGSPGRGRDCLAVGVDGQVRIICLTPGQARHPTFACRTGVFDYDYLIRVGAATREGLTRQFHQDLADGWARHVETGMMGVLGGIETP